MASPDPGTKNRFKAQVPLRDFVLTLSKALHCIAQLLKVFDQRSELSGYLHEKLQQFEHFGQDSQHFGVRQRSRWWGGMEGLLYYTTGIG